MFETAVSRKAHWRALEYHDRLRRTRPPTRCRLHINRLMLVVPNPEHDNSGGQFIWFAKLVLSADHPAEMNKESFLRVRQRVAFLRILRPSASLSFCGGSLTRYVSDQIAAGKFVR